MIKMETGLPIDIKDRALDLHLDDLSWPKTSPDPYEKRLIARGVVFDGHNLVMVHVDRDDQFGKCSYLETSGGGIDKGEKLTDGLKRELREELGIESEIVCFLGKVNDYYNLINRENLNNYFLVRPIGQVEKHLTSDEVNIYHLEKKIVSYDEAFKVYEENRNTKLGSLLYNREVPVLKLAIEVIKSYGLM
jgi:8-oxo-dGTP diphosphatase